MSVKATGPPRRGKRSPTAVWILSRRGKNGTTYRIRWIDPKSGKSLSEACGRDKALARLKRLRAPGQLDGTNTAGPCFRCGSALELVT